VRHDRRERARSGSVQIPANAEILAVALRRESAGVGVGRMHGKPGRMSETLVGGGEGGLARE